MAIVTRASKGSPLTNAEMDNNFTELDTTKIGYNVVSVASTSSLTIAAGVTQQNITALAVEMTINAPAGTPVDSQKLIIRIKDNGTARTLIWNAIWRNLTGPHITTTTPTKTLYFGAVYNADNLTWDITAIGMEP
jgi:hypothetical protein